MTRSADVVRVGHVVATGPSRSFRAMDEKAEVDTAWYAYVEVAADWSSSKTTNRFEVFFPLKATYDTFLDADLPGESAVFFLRSKEHAALIEGWSARDAARERPYAMFVNQDEGLLRDINGKVHAVADDSNDFTKALEGTSFADLVSTVKATLGG